MQLHMYVCMYVCTYTLPCSPAPRLKEQPGHLKTAKAIVRTPLLILWTSRSVLDLLQPRKKHTELNKSCPQPGRPPCWAGMGWLCTLGAGHVLPTCCLLGILLAVSVPTDWLDSTCCICSGWLAGFDCCVKGGWDLGSRGDKILIQPRGSRGWELGLKDREH